jgi:polar amino acid transport system substrate-binding protein
MRRRLVILPMAVAATLALAGCSATSSTAPTAAGSASASAPAATGGAASAATSATPTAAASTTAACTPAALKTKKAGKLTIATGSPADEPWFSGNKPANGKGFESAVAYAVAQQLGYTNAQVSWVHASFDSVIAPTPKNYDFDINEVSITQARKKAVDFSPGYYDVAQAVVALSSDKFATATGVDALHGARLGARVGTTGMDAIKNQIRPAGSVRAYPTNDLAVQALKNGQIDGLVVDLPTGLHLTSAALTNAKIVGQLPVVGFPQKFGLVLSLGSPLTSCVSKAVTALDHAGTLAQLQTRWLTTAAGAPMLH